MASNLRFQARSDRPEDYSTGTPGRRTTRTTPSSHAASNSPAHHADWLPTGGKLMCTDQRLGLNILAHSSGYEATKNTD